MDTLTITSKGQVTIRKDLLRHLGVGPGDRLAVHKRPDGRIEVEAAKRTGRISDVFGILQAKTDVSLTIEEIGEASTRAWAGES